jgi:uncharacterized protein with FMN-binding domain
LFTVVFQVRSVFSLLLTGIHYLYMKKFLLSLTVIATFLLYSFYTKRQGTDVSVISPTVPTPTVAKPSSDDDEESRVSTVPSSVTPAPTKTAGLYKDGNYTGSAADAFYGNIQVKAFIVNGKITDVQFLQYPNDRDRSIKINTMAMPILKSEAISVQNQNVDVVSGATDSSQAFMESLGSALSQAK